MKIKNILLVLAVFFCTQLCAEIQLPFVISDNMVLQQQELVNLFGTAKKNAEVVIKTTWSSDVVKVKSDKDGKWIAKVQTPAAGGPYEISISDGTTKVLKNILIGEVWLCSGQSNMEMPLKGFQGQPVNGANNTIAKAKPSLPIRMFTAANVHSKTKQEDVKGEWSENTPEAVANTSAVGYYYAKYLQEVLGVPVGIIVTAWGGSRIEAWMDRETISSQFPEISIEHLDKDIKTEQPNHRVACQLYNGKMHPFRNFNIKGFLWYQGENNRHDPQQHDRLLPAFVNNLRQVWNNKDLPFYYVQIAPFKYEGADSIGSVGMRDSQIGCMKRILNSGVVVTMDLGDKDCIHPAEKEIVADRLAYWALTKTYNKKGFGYCAPTYKEVKNEGNKIRVIFDYYSSKGLGPVNEDLDNFEIAGEDKIFYPAKAKIDKQTIIVESEKVPHPVAVRYAYKNYVKGNLFDDSGLPVSSFRSDDWEL